MFQYSKGTKIFIGAYVSPPKSEIVSYLANTEVNRSLSTSIKVSTDKQGDFKGVYWKNDKGQEIVLSPAAYNSQFSNTSAAYDLPEDKKR